MPSFVAVSAQTDEIGHDSEAARREFEYVVDIKPDLGFRVLRFLALNATVIVTFQHPLPYRPPVLFHGSGHWLLAISVTNDPCHARLVALEEHIRLGILRTDRAP